MRIVCVTAYHVSLSLVELETNVKDVASVRGGT